MSIKIVGVGNKYRGDDGVGPALIERLALKSATGIDAVSCRCEPADLIEELMNARQVILVDALQPSGSPGQIRRIDPQNIVNGDFAGASTHGFGLGQALSMVEALDRKPDRIAIFAVEGLDFGHGEGLSPPVRAALDKLIDLVEEESRVMQAPLLKAGATQNA